MSPWIAVSRSDHAQARYRPRQGYNHTADQRLVPVLVSELPKMLPHYVLAFTQRDEGFIPMALLGLGSGPNLYLNADGRWLADYVPATLRGYPFILARDPRGQRVLSVHQSHLVTESDEGEPLLTEVGELAPEVQRHATFLQHCAQDHIRTREAVNALTAAELIAHWPLKVRLAANGDPMELGGLYGIDVQRLDTLADERYASLKGPAMTLAYAQRFSQANLEHISRRAIFHANRTAAGPDAGLPEDFGTLFGEKKDDFRFDFDQ